VKKHWFWRFAGAARWPSAEWKWLFFNAFPGLAGWTVAAHTFSFFLIKGFSQSGFLNQRFSHTGYVEA
jgi:hypothetical protein